MDIRIGIANSPREISFESNEAPGAIESTIADALKDGGTHVTLKDNKGNLYIVPIASLSYVEIGTEESRRVGFVA